MNLFCFGLFIPRGCETRRKGQHGDGEGLGMRNVEFFPPLLPSLNPNRWFLASWWQARSVWRRVHQKHIWQTRVGPLRFQSPQSGHITTRRFCSSRNWPYRKRRRSRRKRRMCQKGKEKRGRSRRRKRRCLEDEWARRRREKYFSLKINLWERQIIFGGFIIKIWSGGRTKRDARRTKDIITFWSSVGPLNGWK